MITKKMISEGMKKNLVKLIMSPNGDGVACQIGKCWFYFGGITAEDYNSVIEYKKDIPADTIANKIFTTLESFRTSGQEVFTDEYLYYDLYLQENGIKAA